MVSAHSAALANTAPDLRGEAMFDRLKQAVVVSYVGAIALGYLFAQLVQHFVNIFASPIAGWVERKQYGAFVPRTSAAVGFSLQEAVPELVRFFLLLLFWSVLLRWLYFKPLKKETSEPLPNPEQAG
jgi:uncharacterized protein involved in cysteine biosynthesis